jgi:uncharacterized membrane protein YgcG
VTKLICSFLTILEKKNIRPTGFDKFIHGKGLLFAIFPNTQEAQIEVGYGLESVITEEVSKKILGESVFPELKGHQVDAATLQGIYAILEELNSPLVQSGEANELLRKKGIDASILIEPAPSLSHVWIAGLILGLVCLAWAFYYLKKRSVVLRPHFQSNSASKRVLICRSSFFLVHRG